MPNTQKNRKAERGEEEYTQLINNLINTESDNDLKKILLNNRIRPTELKNHFNTYIKKNKQLFGYFNDIEDSSNRNSRRELTRDNNIKMKQIKKVIDEVIAESNATKATKNVTLIKNRDWLTKLQKHIQKDNDRILKFINNQLKLIDIQIGESEGGESETDTRLLPEENETDTRLLPENEQGEQGHRGGHRSRKNPL
jgi:hypothetical protein